MLHHISIAVDHPHQVATVLAEILQGRMFPFPVCADSYIVLVGDEHGTAIEVLPSGTELIPGKQEVEFSKNAFYSPFSATHAAISVPISQEQIEQIAQREGWCVMACDRGPFGVIELWIENKVLVELLPPAIANRYLEFMKPENIDAFLASAAVAVTA